MDWLRKKMMGRYGADQLSIALMVLYMLVSFTGQLIRLPVLTLVAWIPLIFCFYRILSRDLNRRYEENSRFLKWWAPVREWFGRTSYQLRTRMRNASFRMKDRKTHRYYKCPHCSNTLRVPKGKGKISITCPVCRTEFVKKT